MRELDIYVPVRLADGREMPEASLEAIKISLTNAFGGFARLQMPIEGALKAGGATYHQGVTIFRVLDDRSEEFDITKFKASLETLLHQERVLIVARAVTVVEK